jgi:hypothetical protein
MNPVLVITLAQSIDAHGLKIQGRGYRMFFAKIPRGVKAFRIKCLGGPPISGFIAFLLTSVLKFASGEYYIYPPPSPTSPPCVDLWPRVILIILTE